MKLSKMNQLCFERTSISDDCFRSIVRPFSGITEAGLCQLGVMLCCLPAEASLVFVGMRVGWNMQFFLFLLLFLIFQSCLNSIQVYV